MTNTKDDARRELAVLVAEFEELNLASLAADQAEALARSWIERLLGVLGWDVSNPRQVRQEHTIRGREARRLHREGTTHRRPDYALLLGDERLLYIDAKRFDVSIKDDESTAFQVRSYGWSAGFTVSYACSFEELAIWDCRFKPEADDDARVARIHYLHYTQYAECFDLLWEYLSREALTAGSLQRLHPPDEKPRGAETLDVAFEARLSEWRVELARAILRHGDTRDPGIISGASQRILDRIVFLRICEEMGLEEFGSLNDMVNDRDGFWPLFMEAHEKRYRDVYDGLLFPSRREDDPTGVEHHIREWWLKGKVFEHIVRGLYSPNPYRFDVVPLELLGGIYERFLGKRLRVVGSSVSDEYKPEHQRSKGAVYTPSWIVRRVVDLTLSPLTSGATPESILALRIVDPSCGSGGFLLGVFDHLEQAILDWARANPADERSREHVLESEGALRLTPSCARRIIEGCLHGIDIDPNAVEVARMSLALRFLERAAGDLPDSPRSVLAGIGRNIRQGNSLVEPDIAGLGLDPGRVRATMPFAWNDPVSGFGEVMRTGGFHAVVGNPPYIEVKRYREWMPEMYDHLNESGRYVTTASGKTDIAMPFMEQSMRQLRPGGRLGFIVQNRFFKTDYGTSTRQWLISGRLLSHVEDLRDLQVFPGRTTYTAILILQSGTTEIHYRTFEDRAGAEANVPSVTATIPVESLGAGPWSLDQPDLLAVHADLAKRHGTIGDHRDIEISVGLQTLFGRLYQIQPTGVTSRTVRGVNGLGAEVSLERAAMRPLCRNRGFYPFRSDNADAWVIFPYEVKGSEVRELLWPEFKKRHPKTAAYLEDNKNTLKKAVEVPEGRDRWHLYTRPQNLVVQARPKVLFPMTIEDTVASVDADGVIYQDNVNVNGLQVARNALDLATITAVMNSTVFSALARLTAGLNDGGWRKFNRQFANLVPFPFAALAAGPIVTQLASLAHQITAYQDELRAARGEGERQAMRATLGALWRRLDECVEDAYALTDEQRAILRRHPRIVDRVDLVLRPLAGGNGDDASSLP